MSDARIESMVTITGAEYVAMQAEIERLRAVLEQIADLPTGYADMNPADLVIALADKARAALERNDE